MKRYLTWVELWDLWYEQELKKIMTRKQYRYGKGCCNNKMYVWQ